MARWQPTNNVSKQERVGRRLFDEPLLVGGEPQKPLSGLNLRHFEETRGKEISLDRLGRTGIEKSVINYLLPRAEMAGSKFNPTKPFNGWGVLQAQLFEAVGSKQQKFSTPVIASAVSGSDLEENIYHAHIVMPDEIDSYSMALHLRHLFTTRGTIEYASNEKKPVILSQRIRKWVNSKYKHILSLVKKSAQ